MAITRVKTSSILQNFPKERSMLAGNDGDTGAYESIATVIVPSGGQASIEFTNIPSVYQHLQIRALVRSTSNSSGATDASFRMQINGDTGNNYAWHQLAGDGSSASAFASSSTGDMVTVAGASSAAGTSTFGTGVIDILDYANTNKTKTIRTLGGYDNNGNGQIIMRSGFRNNTAAVTSIKLFYSGLGDFAQYSHIALYGIR